MRSASMLLQERWSGVYFTMPLEEQDEMRMMMTVSIPVEAGKRARANALSVDATTGAMVWCILHNALGGARRNAHDDDGIDSGRSGERGDREWDVGFHHATNPGGDEGGGGVLCHSRRRTNRIYLFRYDRFVATAGGCDESVISKKIYPVR